MGEREPNSQTKCETYENSREYLAALTCFDKNPARFLSHTARSGCSGPKAFSPIAIARTYNGSASSYLPYKPGGDKDGRVLKVGIAQHGDIFA